MMTKLQIKHPIAKKKQNKTFNLLTLHFQELNTQHKKWKKLLGESNHVHVAIVQLILPSLFNNTPWMFHIPTPPTSKCITNIQCLKEKTKNLALHL
jgi:hypothetical protein